MVELNNNEKWKYFANIILKNEEWLNLNIDNLSLENKIYNLNKQKNFYEIFILVMPRNKTHLKLTRLHCRSMIIELENQIKFLF
jgi:hypothetical protein